MSFAKQRALQRQPGQVCSDQTSQLSQNPPIRCHCIPKGFWSDISGIHRGRWSDISAFLAFCNQTSHHLHRTQISLLIPSCPLCRHSSIHNGLEHASIPSFHMVLNIPRAIRPKPAFPHQWCHGWWHVFLDQICYASYVKKTYYNHPYNSVCLCLLYWGVGGESHTPARFTQSTAVSQIIVDFLCNHGHNPMSLKQQGRQSVLYTKHPILTHVKACDYAWNVSIEQPVKLQHWECGDHCQYGAGTTLRSCQE